MYRSSSACSLFFFNDTATTEIYTLSLHDALPIYGGRMAGLSGVGCSQHRARGVDPLLALRRYLVRGFAISDDLDRKSTRLNSSHSQISYAVFCLKKKKILGDSTHRALHPVSQQ